MKTIKSATAYILIFVLSVILMTGVLVLSAKIPHDSIRANMEESAEYLCEKEVFFNILEGVPASEIDRYADSILLNIAWNLDGGDALKRVMWTSYYYKDYQNENENLFESVNDGYEANQEYMRYWHGSAAIVRFLHLFLNLKGIYILNGIILAVLAGAVFFLLNKNKLSVLSIGLVVSFISVSAWFVPFCLEYTWTFILMLIFSILAVILELKGKTEYIGAAFLISGILTNYLDFLTTETLTLLIPLILVLYIRLITKEHPVKEGLRLFISSLISWGAGYVLTWISKWVLASLFLGENMMSYVTGHVQERMNEAYGIPLFRMLTGAVSRNLSCLFPFNYGAAGVIAGICLIIFLIYVLYVYRKYTDKKEALLLLSAAGLLPYIRYLTLRNHSYIHFFFTHRAQAATILVLCIAVSELSDFTARLPLSRPSFRSVRRRR